MTATEIIRNRLARLNSTALVGGAGTTLGSASLTVAKRFPATTLEGLEGRLRGGTYDLRKEHPGDSTVQPTIAARVRWTGERSRVLRAWPG